MNASRWREVTTAFHALLEHDGDARAAMLADIERRDPDLAGELRSLLRGHESGTLLDTPVWQAVPDLILEDGPAPVGSRVGGYQVLEEIGRGGMGVVYAARDERLGRMVALKALPPAYTDDPLRRARLTREARAAAALSHPAVATIFSLEEIDGGLYIVSELVRGDTLRQELRDGPLAPERLLPTLLEIGSALAAAHALGIVHRDLKPENVIRRSDGQIKVLDFGLARWEAHPDAPSMTRLTEAGIALGTPGYMAPEQLRGEPTDVRADVFAFGVLAWELATGEHPFGTDPASVLTRMTALMEGRAVLPGQALPGLERMVLKSMRAAPDERYPTITAALEDLRAVAVPHPTGTARPPAPHRTALWWWQFHQATVAVLVGLTPVLTVLARRALGPPYGRWLFLAVLGLATIAVTLRLNLLFTSRVHGSMLTAHRRRLFPWIIAAETAIAGLLLAGAAAIGADADIAAAPLLSLAVILLASLAIIEPATTAGARLYPRSGSSRS